MSSAVGATFQDRTLNKVAVCSAVFAGFAYVGYSYARTAFCRKLSRRPGHYENDSHEVSRMVFRRLSHTTQTDALLGHLDENTGGRLIIRPKSVQARIRELNLRAHQFSDTFVAIQSNGGPGGPGVSRTHAMHTHHSLQCSPWSSPRLLSPVDVRGITSSQSTENLAYLPRHTSPTRPNWVRRSLRRKKNRSDFSQAAASNDGSMDDELNGEEERMEVEVGGETEVERRTRMERETREMYSSNKEQLIHRLKTLMDRGRLLSPFEAKTLVALLCAEDAGLLERTLVTIANCATFTLNVELLRESGCIVRLCSLLCGSDDRIRLAAVQTLGNVLLAEESIAQAQSCLEPLLSNVVLEPPDAPLNLASLVVLTNIATISTWHPTFCPTLPRLYQLAEQGSGQAQLQALRLLVNLSCNRAMVPPLLAQGPSSLCQLVSSTTDRGVLLRVLTLLATLTTHVAENRLSMSADGLPPASSGRLTPTLLTQEEEPASAAAPDAAATMPDDFIYRYSLLQKFSRMFSPDVRAKLLSQSDEISRYHPDPEVRRQATRLRASLQVQLE